jgi:iron complex transport system permease protein
VSARHVAVRVKRPPMSARVSVRTLGLISVAGGLVGLATTWALTLGDFPLSVGEVVDALVGGATGPADFIVRTLRMPRVLVGVGVGFALAASGAIFQGLVRNPLVSPDIIGVNAGASLAAVFFIVTRGPAALLPVAAFAGALIAALSVYVLAWRKGITGARLVLVGIGINAIATAGTTFLIVRFPIEVVSSAELWLSGTLYARGWEHVRYIALALALLLPAALALASRLRTLQLGDEVARALGVSPEPARGALLVAGSGLAAAAVAAAGPIAFVALIVPHIARMLVGPFTSGVLVLSGLLGAVLVIGSDLVAQHAFAPVTLPAGVVTAALGAPYFMFLLYRTHRRS